MGVLLANNARSSLAASISAAATIVTVMAGHGSRFPSIIAADDWFPLVLENSAGETEYLRCTGRAGDAFTVARGQEGSAPRSYTAGDAVELRLTTSAAIELAEAGDGTPEAAAAYADGTPIDELRPAEIGATKGAPAGTLIGDALAEDVVSSLVSQALTVAQEALRSGTWRAEASRILYPESGLTIIQLIEQIGVTVNGLTSYINFLREMSSNGDGKVLLTINSQGAITGTMNTLTGLIGAYKIMADEFALLDPNGGNRLVPFYYGLDNILRMQNVRIEGDLMVLGSIKSESLAPKALSDGDSVSLASPLWGSGGYVNALTYTLTVPDGEEWQAVVLVTASQGFPYGDRTWNLELYDGDMLLNRAGGMKSEDSLALSGRARWGQGQHFFRCKWMGAGGATLSGLNMVVIWFKK